MRNFNVLTFLGLICASSALANEVRIYHPDNKAIVASSLTVDAKPRTDLRLVADLFSAPEGQQSGDLSPQKREPTEFTWTVSCTDSQLENGCNDSGISCTSEGVSFLVPDFLKENETLELRASYIGGGKAYVKVRNAAGAEVSPQSPRRRSGPGAALFVDGRAPEEKKSKDKKSTSSGHSYGGGASSSSGGGKRSRSKKDRYEKESDETAFGNSFYGGSGSSYGGGSYGGNGGSAGGSGTRGYNRDNETPVVSCSQRPKHGGGLAIECEKPDDKVLRVRPKTDVAKAALSRKSSAKQFTLKKAISPRRQMPAKVRPSRAPLSRRSAR